jgi:hypothetical protein
VVMDDAVFSLKGQKLYDLKGSNIYKLNGDLVGHLPDARGVKKRLDKATPEMCSPQLPGSPAGLPGVGEGHSPWYA